ncbi:single-stranded-DNA-specific exonuclease RecJ [Candidatus Saccharibacteria bacterium]|nr:single-stranded-DNA-specific exonuclease RecJ [Candidatus Saccharibacteria bacterium]
MSKLFDELVKKRGFSTQFLKPEYEGLPSPWLLPDMRKAVERIREAAKRGERVIIYGDYDVDGVTASTVVSEALRLAGVKEIEVMLPDRFKDGYGMSEKVVERAKETGASLVVTVDCGSGNKEIVAKLREEGVETVVTDHHECPEELPEAVAVVNPKRRDVAKCVPEFEEHLDELMWLRDLAGVGVAFMLARGMMEEGMIPAGQEKWLLDLVLIGTICDSMRMSEVNRILCFYGVKVLAKTRRAGLKELMRVSQTKKITAETIGFQIGPRLNAAGRMANAEVALDLLRAPNKVEGASLALELEKLNGERRNQQLAAMKEFSERGVPDDAVLVATGKWHEGVLGIIAGKLVDDYKRPAFVLSEVEEGVLKGSGRSFGDFSLAEALKACGDVIIGGGGHAGAAGVRVLKEKLAEFRKKLNAYYESLDLTGQERYFEKQADLEVRELGGFTLEFLKELASLEPFGPGNEMPVFRLPEMFVLDKKLMGASEQHLRLLVRGEDEKTLKLVAFGAPEEWRRVENGERVNLLAQVEENEWNGLRSVEGRILDLRGC